MQSARRVGKNVQNKKKQINGFRISRLDKKAGPCLNSKALALYSSYNSKLATIIFEHTIPNIFYLYTGKKYTNSVPLWFSLIRSKGSSLRTLSPEWNRNSFQLLEAFTKFDGRLNLSSEASLLKFKMLKTSSSKKISNKLKIINYDLKDKELERIVYEDKVRSVNVSLIALFFSSKVKIRSLTEKDESKISELYRFITFERLKKRPLIESLNVLNSLNLISLKTDLDKKKLMSNIVLAKKLLKYKGESKESAHFLGINYYHTAVFYKISGNLQKYVSNLELARKYDVGFYDYSYKLAIYYHDAKKLLRAKYFYELALKTSSFDKSLVNDYGVLLQELNLTKDLKFLKEVYFESKK